MRPRTNRVCIQGEIMRMQRHARIFGIIARERQEQYGSSWAQARLDLKRELTLKNLALCMTI